MALTARALPGSRGPRFAARRRLWLAFTAPKDYQQGETVRIMYLHVPSAWLSLLIYTVMSISAIGALVWRHPLAEVSMKAAAPIGCVFSFLCLVTGALWGKPMWGAWWVWDARLDLGARCGSSLPRHIGDLGRHRGSGRRGARRGAGATLVGFVVFRS